MNIHALPLLLLLALMHVGCSDDALPQNQTNSDMQGADLAQVTDSDMIVDLAYPKCGERHGKDYFCEPSPLTPGTYCCPAGPPSCDCTFTGGSFTPGKNIVCPGICDAAPVNWARSTDENGCTVLSPQGGFCFVPPDDMGIGMKQTDMSQDMQVEDMTQTEDLSRIDGVNKLDM